ncbi:hypothetical protein [Shinella sp.]|uniref:hypothetical protein n=1 Tax=Shinella sp. TaxID=1870904 RepID=UPI0028B08857|nr:hypothetical protein [Shinella sp.]
MLDRCDLNPAGECSCLASNVPCKVQGPLDLGVFTGTNHPGPLDGYPETARDTAIGLTILAFIVFAIIVGLGAQVAPAAI